MYAAGRNPESPMELKNPFACGEAVSIVPDEFVLVRREMSLGVGLKYPDVKSHVVAEMEVQRWYRRRCIVGTSVEIFSPSRGENCAIWMDCCVCICEILRSLFHG